MISSRRTLLLPILLSSGLLCACAHVRPAAPARAEAAASAASTTTQPETTTASADAAAKAQTPAASAASAAATENTTTTPAPEASVLLSAIGDIRLDGPVGRFSQEHGPAAVTAEALRWLKADIVFGNLEAPLTLRGEKTDKKFTFRAPPKNLDILEAAGFTILNLANNHIVDFGPVGLLDTLAALDARGFLHVGAGRNLDEARRPVIIEKNGLRVGFLALTSTHPDFAWARKERPGVAYSDFDRFPEWIRQAKSSCDVLIVSFHGGTERAELPNEIQRAFGHMAVDAGADLVLGHHPHVLQPVELYKGRIILHSIGNGLFVSPSPETRAGAIVRILLKKNGPVLADFVPVDTWSGGKLRLAPEAAKTVTSALDRDGALTAHPELFRVLQE
ncbi:MAG: CapA family protein [Elusimicrobiota bacterium]|jgi:poly-gamma-glutamate synthesis protein (capsule biosynthesis protein)